MEMKQLNIEIPAQLYKDLGIYCITKDEKKKEVVANALQQYLNTKEKY